MTNTRHPILIARIPAQGRALTGTEARALRAAGVRNVPARGWVMPAQGSDYIGAVYRSVETGLSDAGISVTTRA